MITSFQNGRVD